MTAARTPARHMHTADTDPMARVEQDLDRLMASVRDAVTGDAYEALLPTFARIAAIVPVALPSSPPPETFWTPLPAYPWET